VKRVFLIILYPLALFLMGYLNYSKAGLLALNILFIVAILYQLKSYFKNRFFDILFFILLFYMIGFVEFHAALKDIFGVAQDDYMIIKAIIDTDSNETKEFFIQYKTYLIKHVLIAIFVFLFYFYIFKKNTTFNKKIFIITLILFIISQLNPTLRRNNPFIYFEYYYFKYQKEVALTNNYFKNFSKNRKSSNIDAEYVGKEKNTLVWVIGESNTKKCWSLYGYKRDTNAFLEKYKDKIFLFKNIYAAAPATIEAFELMLTKANRSHKDWLNTMDILTLAKKAGYKIYWISNHSTDTRGIINVFAKYSDKFIMTNKGGSRGEGSYDESVFLPLKKALDDNTSKKLIIVHLLEAHPAYDFRYPKEFSHFHKDEVYENLSQKRASWALFLRNTYDNAIYYSDYIKSKILQMVIDKNKDNSITLLYNPDHGEDVLFHSNFAGHNAKAIEQWEIPMFLYTKKFFIKKSYLDRKYQLDEVDNLILHLLQIKTKFYNPTYDILSDKFKSKISLPKDVRK